VLDHATTAACSTLAQIVPLGLDAIDGGFIAFYRSCVRCSGLVRKKKKEKAGHGWRPYDHFWPCRSCEALTKFVEVCLLAKHHNIDHRHHVFEFISKQRSGWQTLLHPCSHIPSMRQELQCTADASECVQSLNRELLGYHLSPRWRAASN
jgi:hypothetical protein